MYIVKYVYNLQKGLISFIYLKFRRNKSFFFVFLFSVFIYVYCKSKKKSAHYSFDILRGEGTLLIGQDTISGCIAFEKTILSEASVY